MGAVIKLELSDLPAALDRTEERVRTAIARGALAGAHRGRAVVVKATPVDQGPLKAGWRVKPGASTFTTDALFATLTNDAPHIAVVELGSRPHGMSPTGWQALYEWVRRHYRGGTLGGTGRMRPRRSMFAGLSAYRGDDPVITKITNAIVHRIATKGTPATLFVRNSLPAVRAVMVDELLRALTAVKGAR